MIGISPDDLRAAAAGAMLLGPLAGAGLALLSPSHRLGWWASSLIALAVAAASVVVAAGGATIAAPLSARTDSIMSALAPILGLGGAACVIATGWLAPSDAGPRGAALTLVLAQLAWFGWMGAAFANDLTIGASLMMTGWIALAALCASGAARDRGALGASLRMLMIGVAAGLAFAIGAAFVQAAAGAVDLADIAARETAAPRLRAAGFALMIGACACAAIAAPLNLWTGAAMTRGARIASLMIACVAAIGALAIVARLMLAAAIADAGLGKGLSVGLAALGGVSLALGSLQAMGAQDVRRIAGHAAAAQSGAILIAFALLTPIGHAAGMMSMASSALISLGLLSGAALIGGQATLAELSGFGRRAPIGGAAIAVAALGLIGAPLTLGFLSRWRLIEASLAGGWWWAAGLVILGSLAAVFYAGRLLERLYARPAAPIASRPPWRVSLTPAHVLAISGAIALGLNATEFWLAANLAGDLLAGAAQ